MVCAPLGVLVLVCAPLGVFLSIFFVAIVLSNNYDSPRVHKYPNPRWSHKFAKTRREWVSVMSGLSTFLHKTGLIVVIYCHSSKLSVGQTPRLCSIPSTDKVLDIKQILIIPLPFSLSPCVS